VEDRSGYNDANVFEYTKYQLKRYKGKRYGELSCNPKTQEHRTAQAVVNRTNQDNNTTNARVDNHQANVLNKKDEKITMISQEPLTGRVVKVVATEYIISPKSKRNINGF